MGCIPKESQRDRPRDRFTDNFIPKWGSIPAKSQDRYTSSLASLSIKSRTANYEAWWCLACRWPVMPAGEFGPTVQCNSWQLDPIIITLIVVNPTQNPTSKSSNLRLRIIYHLIFSSWGFTQHPNFRDFPKKANQNPHRSPPSRLSAWHLLVAVAAAALAPVSAPASAAPPRLGGTRPWRHRSSAWSAKRRRRCPSTQRWNSRCWARWPPRSSENHEKYMGGSWEFRGKREKDPKLMIYHVPYDSLAIWRHPLICRKDQKRIEKAIIWKLNSESRGCEATNMKIQLLLGICRVAPQQIVVKRGGTCVFFVNTMSRPLSYAWARVDTSMANPGSPPKKENMSIPG